MPPRVRLSAEERRRLPALLAAAQRQVAAFPYEASAEAQIAWLCRCYGSADAPLTVPLLTLLLFEHGVHRSASTVRAQLEAARAAQLLTER